MAAGHAISFIMLQSVQCVSHKIGEKAPLQGDRIKMGQCIPWSNGGKENISDKGNIVTQGQDKEGFIRFDHPVFQIKGHNENDRKEIVTDIGKGHDICKPGDDPSLHPEGGMDSKKGMINLDQYRIDIRVEVLNQIPEGLIDDNDKENGREVMKEPAYPPHYFSI
jgi:hypothetical protein